MALTVPETVSPLESTGSIREQINFAPPLPGLACHRRAAISHSATAEPGAEARKIQ